MPRASLMIVELSLQKGNRSDGPVGPALSYHWFHAGQPLTTHPYHVTPSTTTEWPPAPMPTFVSYKRNLCQISAACQPKTSHEQG